MNWLEKDVTSNSKFFFPSHLADSGNVYYRTQTGMRGVQDKVPIKVEDKYDEIFQKFYKRGVK